MLVRAMERGDLPQVAPLVEQLGHAMALPDLERFFDAAAARPDQAILVAVDGERVVGWIHAYRTQLLYFPPFVEVAGLVVDAARRRAGAGSALLCAVERWAEETGCRQVRLRSRTTRGEAHAFYERLGYTNEKAQFTFAKAVAPSAALPVSEAACRAPPGHRTR
jgi:GNAT superfamily N-acetyltransferase